MATTWESYTKSERELAMNMVSEMTKIRSETGFSMVVDFINMSEQTRNGWTHFLMINGDKTVKIAVSAGGVVSINGKSFTTDLLLHDNKSAVIQSLKEIAADKNYIEL